MSQQLCYRHVFGIHVCSKYKNKMGGSQGNYRRIYAVYLVHTTTTFPIPVAAWKLQELSTLIKSHLSTLHCYPPSFKKLLPLHLSTFIQETHLLHCSPAIHLSLARSALYLHVTLPNHRRRSCHGEAFARVGC